MKLGGDLTRSKKVVEELRKNKKKMLAKCEKLENVVEDQKIMIVSANSTRASYKL